MCGIVGVFGKITPQYVKMFEDMWDMDVLRGKDSSGIAIITKQGTEIIKDTVLPHELRLYYKEYEEAFKKKNNQQIIGLIGHNRFSTRGSVNTENSHPFKHGDITLVHNGTAWTFNLPDDQKFPTDSESICNGIDKLGIEEVWKRVSGAMTLVYWNNKDQSFNLISNGKRPMNFVYSKDKETIFLASESWMLFTAGARNNIEFHSTESAKWYYLGDNRLYDFHYENNKLSYGTLDIKEKEIVVQKVDHSNSYRGNFRYNKQTGEWEDKDQPKNNNVIPFRHNKKPSWEGSSIFKINPRAKTISRKDYEMYYTTCCGCHRGIKEQYVESVILNYDNCEALCKTCVEIGESNNLVERQSVTVH